jgi:PAS domain S-box-containing protein
MVVEDEGIVAADISATLKRFGYDVVGVSTTVDDCMRKVREMRPDLMLMDINLHGHREGVDAAIKIREELRIPAIFLTAYADDATIAHAKIAEPVGYIIKPFKPNELRVVIEMALHRRRLERRVERQQAFLEAIFDWAGVGIAVLDACGRVVDRNRTLTQMLGIGDGVECRLEHLAHVDLVAREQRLFERVARGEREQYQMETRYVRANQEIALGYVTGTRVAHPDGAVQVVRVLSDISYARLEKLASFQENERHLISSEIHDVISQPLAGVYYRLEATRQIMSRDVDNAHSQLSSSLEVVQRLLEELSRLIYNLRSPVFDGTSIGDGLERLCNEFRHDTDVALRAVLPREVHGLGRLHALFLYRIVQESLTNVRRHANARHVELTITVEDGRVHGRIQDDGTGPSDGYEREEEHKRKHFGVRAMRERAQLLGGHLDVSPAAGGGTSVTFEFPVSEDPPDE